MTPHSFYYIFYTFRSLPSFRPLHLTYPSPTCILSSRHLHNRLYVSPLHPPTPAHKALTPRQWLLEGFEQRIDEDIPSLDEVRKAISFQSTEVETSPTAARPVRAKAPMDGVARIKATPGEGCVPQGNRPLRAKLLPDEEPIPVVREHIPPEDGMLPTEEVILTIRARLPFGEDSAHKTAEEDMPAMPARAKLPFDEGLVRPIRAKLPSDEDSILVVRAKVPPEDLDERASNSSTEETIPIIRAKLPPGEDGFEDLQQTTRPARAAKLPGAGSRPLRAKLPPGEEPIPVVRARLPPEDLDELHPGEDGIEDVQQTSRPSRAKLPGAGSRPLRVRAKLPPDEESIPVVGATLPSEDLDERASNSSTDEVVPIVRAKLPPAEGNVIGDVQQTTKPARAKLPGAGSRPLRAKLPPDEESIPVVGARLPPDDVEEQVSVLPLEDSVTLVKAKPPEGRGTQQVPRPTRAKLPPDDENSPTPQGKVKSKVGSVQSQTFVDSILLSGLPKNPRNIPSPNLPQAGGSPTARGPKQPTKRASSLISQQSSPSPPPLQPSLSPSPTDGGQISVEAEQAGSKAKVVTVSRLPASPSSSRNPSARGLAIPSSQKLLAAKGDRAVPSSSSGNSSTPRSVASRQVLPGGEGDSPSSLKVPSKPSPRSKTVASPSVQQKQLVSAPTSRYATRHVIG